MPVIYTEDSTLVAAHAYVTVPPPVTAEPFTPVDILVSYADDSLSHGAQSSPASPVAIETQPANMGPFLDGSAIYFVSETPLSISNGGTETGSQARSTLWKSTDRGTTWNLAESANTTDDIEAGSVWYSSVTGELMEVFIDGDTDDVFSRRWGMASRSGFADRLIDTSAVLVDDILNYVEVEQVCVHSYGAEDLLCAYTRPNGSDTYDEIWMSWYDTSLNTWSTPEVVDQEASTQFNTVQVYGDASGTTHIVYADSSNDLWHRTYTAGVLSARQKVNTNGVSVITSDLDSGRNAYGSIVGIHHNAGVLHVVWYSETAGQLYHNTIADGQSPGSTPTLVSTRVCSHHFTEDATIQGPNACLVGDDDDLFVFFGDATTRDLYVAEYSGSWQTETLHRSMYLMHISANVLDFGGGDRVIGIIAEDAGGPGPSTPAEGQLSYDEYALTGTPAPPAIPAVPTGLNAVDATSGGRVNLTWTAGVGGGAPTDYVVEYDQGGGWTIFADNVTTATSANVTGLTDDVSCDFRVSAKNATGTSSPSTTATATPTTSAGGSPSWLVASRTTTNGSTSINFTIPNTASVGDTVAVHVISSSSSGAAGATPAGWVQRTTADHSDYSATSYSCVVTSGSANPTDPSDVVTFLRSNSSDLTVRGVVISNIPGTVNNTDIVSAAPAGPNTIAGSVTTSAECVIVSFCSVDPSSAGSWTEDQSADEVWDETMIGANFLGSACYIKQVAAGTYTPTYTYTPSTSNQEIGLEIIAFDV